MSIQEANILTERNQRSLNDTYPILFKIMHMIAKFQAPDARTAEFLQSLVNFLTLLFYSFIRLTPMIFLQIRRYF